MDKTLKRLKSLFKNTNFTTLFECHRSGIKAEDFNRLGDELDIRAVLDRARGIVLLVRNNEPLTTEDIQSL